MKTVGLKYFRNNLRKVMKELPVALTHRGQTVAVCVASDFFDFILSKSTHGVEDPSDSGQNEEQL